MNRTLEDLRLTLTALVYAEESRALMEEGSAQDRHRKVASRVGGLVQQELTYALLRSASLSMATHEIQMAPHPLAGVCDVESLKVRLAAIGAEEVAIDAFVRTIAEQGTGAEPSFFATTPEAFLWLGGDPAVLAEARAATDDRIPGGPRVVAMLGEAETEAPVVEFELDEDGFERRCAYGEHALDAEDWCVVDGCPGSRKK